GTLNGHATMYGISIDRTGTWRDSTTNVAGPLLTAVRKQKTASKQSQLINPLELLICCVTLKNAGERTGKAWDMACHLPPQSELSICFYFISTAMRTFLSIGIRYRRPALVGLCCMAAFRGC